MDWNIAWLALAGLLFAIPVWSVSRRLQKFDYDRDQFVLAGRALPPGRYGLAEASLVWLGPLLLPHMGFVARAGLSAAVLALAIPPMLAATALFAPRLARLARHCHQLTPAELIGSFYQSPRLRQLVALTAVPVALCLAVLCLRLGGDIGEGLAGQRTDLAGLSLPRLAVMAALAVLLLLQAAMGGMGAVLRVAAGTALLTGACSLALLLLAIGAAGGLGPLLGWLQELMARAAAAQLFMPGPPFDTLPAAAPANLAWPGGMALSSLLAAAGLAIAPAALMARFSASPSARGASRPVVFAIAAGLLLLVVTPAIGLLPHALASAAGYTATGAQPIASTGRELVHLASLLAAAPLAVPGIAAFVIALLATALLSAASAALLAAAISLGHDFSTRRTARALRAPLRQRIRVNAMALTAGALLIALSGPADALPLALLAGAYALQLLPAVYCISFAPIIDARAIERGLVAGLLMVTATGEPVGWIGGWAGLSLPFAPWPLGLHPAVWGLAANLLSVAITQAFDRRENDGPGDAESRAFRRAYSQLAGTLSSSTPSLRRLAIAVATLFGVVVLAPLVGPVDTRPSGAGLPPLWLWQGAAFLAGLPLVYLLAHRLQPAGEDGEATPVRPRLRLRARQQRHTSTAARSPETGDETP